MIPTYRVHTLRLGTIRWDKGESRYDAPPGTIVDLPIWAAAVEGNGHRLLVDTGLGNAEKWSHLWPHALTPEESLDTALAELGWKRRDVEIVINTHLHYDHAENNIAFPDAQFFASATEWEFAHDPGNAQADLYGIEWTNTDLTYMNYTLVPYDHYSVLPGLRIIQTPGHTPGHQSVLVNTQEGILCVAGDAAAMPEDFFPPAPPRIHTSARASLDSLHKIATLSSRLLMAHDPQLKAFQSNGFPPTPNLGI